MGTFHWVKVSKFAQKRWENIKIVRIRKVRKRNAKMLFLFGTPCVTSREENGFVLVWGLWAVSDSDWKMNN
jgi:hypothetical protein